jgi:hypothetical protein
MATQKCYPKIDEIAKVSGRIEAGELLVYRWLCEVLDEEDEILIQPMVGGKYPDVIVLRGGIIYVIEVKDYRLNNYTVSGNDWITIDNNRLVSNPFIQVLDYAKRIRIAATTRLIMHHDDPPISNLVVPIVAFTNALLKEMKQHPMHQDIWRSIDSYRSKVTVWDQDVLSANICPTVFGTKQQFNLQLHDIDVKAREGLLHAWNCLRGTVVSQSDDGRSFSLDAKQRKWIEHKDNCFQVHGPAGSGKTTVMINRAKHMIDFSTASILIIHNTNTLGHFLQARLARTLGVSLLNARVMSTHHVMEQILIGMGVKVSNTKGTASYFAKRESVIRNAQDNALSTMTTKRYDAVLVDEVQDFDSRDLEVIRLALVKPEGGWFLFGDVEQNTLGRPLSSERLPKTNLNRTWGKLSTVYRNRGQRAQVMGRLHSALFSDSVNEYEVGPAVQTTLFTDFNVNLEPFKSERELGELLISMRSFKGDADNTTAIITTDRRLAQCIDFTLSRLATYSQVTDVAMPLSTFDEQSFFFNTNNLDRQIGANPWDLDPTDDFWNVKKLQIREQMIKYQMYVGVHDKLKSSLFGLVPTGLAVGTLQLFKGLEFNNIIFIGNSLSKRNNSNDIQLWTAITRGRSNVHIMLPEGSEYLRLLAGLI